MAKIVVGNVDCEAQCGDPARRDAAERAQSSRVAHRMAWFLERGDLFLAPFPISRDMLQYIGRFNGFEPDDIVQMSANADSPDSVLITEEFLRASNYIEQVRKALRPGCEYGLVAYFPDRGMGHLARMLGLAVDEPQLAFLCDGHAELLNRKSFFKATAADLGISTAPGRVCATSGEYLEAIEALIRKTGSVIVKQDSAGGGEGNVAITADASRNSHTGTYRTYHGTSATDLARIASETWAHLTDSRNRNLIVESFIPDARTYYAELDVDSRTGRSRAVVRNKGFMRMAPTWVGFEYPIGDIPEPTLRRFVADCVKLGDKCASFGYGGKLNCDVIVDSHGELYFTEMNIRYGGCSHIDEFCRRTLGDDYERRKFIKTRNIVPFHGTFPQLQEVQGRHQLDFEHMPGCGIAIMAEDLSRTGFIEYAAIADSEHEVRRLEERFSAALATAPAPLAGPRQRESATA